MIAKRPSVSTQFVILLLFVLLINGVVFFFMLKNVYQQELRAQAQTVVANVEAFGSWVAKNGRVWVKDNSESFLGKLQVTSTESPSETMHFFSKNPALAQREFSETVEASDSPAKFRMTSSNVMNPSNAPDFFEQRALQAIESQGLQEYSETVGANYRYAQPVFHTESCIGCHGQASEAPADVIAQYGRENGFGFQVGDVAGIISVTIPQRNILTGAVSVFGLIEIAAIVLSVLVILWFVRRQIIAPVSELTLVAEKISKGESVELDTSTIAKSSKNEIDQLKLATGRMATSFSLSVKKMYEYRQSAAKAIKVAKELKAKQSSSNG